MAGAGNKKKGLTPEKLAEVVARDRRLKAGLGAKDDAVTVEATGVALRNAAKMAKKGGRFLLRDRRWPDVCQKIRETILRWRDDPSKLRPDESMWYFTIRLFKQVAEAEKNDRDWQKLAFSLDEHAQGSPEQQAFEAEVEEQGGEVWVRRIKNPEQQAAIDETVAWVAGAALQMSAADQAALEALGRQIHGFADTVGEALGIRDDAGRQRKGQMLGALAQVAVTQGNWEMLYRLVGKAKGEALELFHVAPPDADHRREDCVRFREGLMDTAEAIAFKQHVAGCNGCKYTLRDLDVVEEAVRAFVLAPLLPVGLGTVPRGNVGSGDGVGAPSSKVGTWVGVAAAAVAALWWFWPAGSKPVATRDAGAVVADAGRAAPVRVPMQHRLYSAPQRAERVDAGVMGDAGRP